MASPGPTTTVHQMARGLDAWCLGVPAPGPGVCEVCRGSRRPGFSLCFGCRLTLAGVSRPCRTVVPISLVTLAGPLYGTIRSYKDAVSAEERRRSGLRVAVLLARFVHDHGPCIARRSGGGWDYLTTVPSTARRGEHPLSRALDHVPWLARQHRTTLRRGLASMSHRRPDDDGYRVIHPVTGDRVLLVDDLWTSGARAQSAASALQRAGAVVLGIVPAGRVVDPEFDAFSDRSLRRWSGRLFDPSVCSLCAADQATRSGATRSGATGCDARDPAA